MARQIQNWFTTMINRYNGNQEFVPFLKPEQIQKGAKERIFKEMALGRINYETYGNYFLDPKFLENLIVASDDEVINCSTILQSLKFYDTYNPGQLYVVRNITRYSMLLPIYSVIQNRLNAVKVSGTIAPLADIPYVLKDYSKVLQ